MRGRTNHTHDQRLACIRTVVVVGQHVDHVGAAVLNDRLTISVGVRVVVDVGHRDGDRGCVRAAVAVAHLEGEGVGTVEVRVRRVGLVSTRARKRALGGATHHRVGEAVAVYIATSESNCRGGVLICRHALSIGCRRVVDSVHRDRNVACIGQCTVAHSVVEARRAVEVGGRREGDGAVAVDYWRAARRVGRGGDRQSGSLDVSVICKHAEGDSGVLAGRRCVIYGHRSIIDSIHRDRDRSRVRATVAVAHLEGEGVGTVEVRVRSVGHVRRCAGECAVAGLADDAVAEVIAVYVATGEGNRLRGVLNYRYALCIGDRSMVARDHHSFCIRGLLDDGEALVAVLIHFDGKSARLSNRSARDEQSGVNAEGVGLTALLRRGGVGGARTAVVIRRQEIDHGPIGQVGARCYCAIGSHRVLVDDLEQSAFACGDVAILSPDLNLKAIVSFHYGGRRACLRGDNGLGRQLDIGERRPGHRHRQDQHEYQCVEELAGERPYHMLAYPFMIPAYHPNCRLFLSPERFIAGSRYTHYPLRPLNYC